MTVNQVPYRYTGSNPVPSTTLFCYYQYMKLQNKTVVVTGATGGIGSVLASHLAHEDAKLVLLGRNPAKLAELAASLRGDSSQVTTYACDLTKATERGKVTRQILKSHPKIDLLIHSAGIGIDKPFSEITEEDWDTSYKLNVKAPFFLTQSLLPALDQALVLVIGSQMALAPTAGRSLYCPTKAALRSTVLTLQEEFSDKPTSFCLLTLGPVMTNFGNRTTKDREEEAKAGKSFFTPEWVANKLVEIIKEDKRETEYTLYPGDYGFGTWNKP